MITLQSLICDKLNAGLLKVSCTNIQIKDNISPNPLEGKDYQIRPNVATCLRNSLIIPVDPKPASSILCCIYFKYRNK